MKKLLLSAIAMTSLLFITSCEKTDYTCTCVWSNNGTATVVSTTTYHQTSHSSSQAACSKAQTDLQSSYSTGLNCSLK